MGVSPPWTGTGSRAEPTFGAVHALALRPSAAALPPGGDSLLSLGLAERSGAGFLLTGEGYRLHRAMLDRERASIDIVSLGMAYAPVASLSRRLSQLRIRWQEVPTDRPLLVDALGAFVALAQIPLLRAAAIVPRFGDYGPRLRDAARRLDAGDLRFAIDPSVGSIAVTWDDLHEDYLQTLGRGHELEEL